MWFKKQESLFSEGRISEKSHILAWDYHYEGTEGYRAFIKSLISDFTGTCGFWYLKGLWSGSMEHWPEAPLMRRIFDRIACTKHDYSIDVFRGISRWEDEPLRVGQTIELSRPTSFSRSFGKAKEYAISNAGDSEIATVFVLETDEFGDISEYSEWPGESEVILRGNFIITSIERRDIEIVKLKRLNY